jgi:hypothetical protein
MTKQSSHARRRRPNTLWIAMLATLAFVGAGQALAPAPAAALHIEACAQPESGLCDAADEGPTSGPPKAEATGTSAG